jgi:hypothetical protein
MKKITLLAVFLFACTLSAAAQTQSNTTHGPVWRVIYLRVLPGKTNDTWMDMRKNLRPIYEEAKKQGVIADYKLYANSTKSSPEDWDIALAIAYKNWGAIDGSTARMNEIGLKHYGSSEKQEAAAANRRQLAQTVVSKLIREQTLNPLP